MVDAVPGNAGAQLGELIRWIAPREHVEHAVEDPAAQIRERGGAADDREQLVDPPAVDAGHRDDLLREDVQGVSRVAGRLDLPVVHRARDGGARDQIAAELGEDDSFADRPGLMSGAADALHAAGDRRRRFDLHYQIDRAHIDAEFQRRGGDQRLDAARFQQVFDVAARFACQRSVMRAYQRLARQLVERAGKPLRQAPAVDEQQRGLMLANQLEKPRMDRGPDRRAGRPLRRRSAGQVDSLRGAGHVLDRHFDPQFQLFLVRCVHDRHRAERRRLLIVGELAVQLSLDVLDGNRVLAPGALRGRTRRFRNRPRLDAAEEMGNLLERTLRGRQTYPLERPAEAGRPQFLQALQRQRQVRPALARHERVDLVDDHCVDRLQPLTRL